MTEIPRVDEIAGRFVELQEQVRAVETAAGRAEGSVQIELAANYQASERVLAALRAGGVLLGHNIIQQLEASETALAAANAPAHRTHVIGHVQKNKAAKALRYSQCIETVDSFKLAARLDRLWGERLWDEGVGSERVGAQGRAQGGAQGRAQADGSQADGSQADGSEKPTASASPSTSGSRVNASGAESQYGRDPEQVLELTGRIAELPNLRIAGLMTIGAHTDSISEIARSFQVVRELRDKLQAAGIGSATELSMGMTHDMDIAIAEGSTIIRVGTAVFGPTAGVSTPARRRSINPDNRPFRDTNY